MDFCNQLYPPQDCTGLVAYVTQLVSQLAETNAVRAGTSAGVPDDAALNALWAPCDPSIGALASWWDSNASEGLLFVTIDGATWEQLYP